MDATTNDPATDQPPTASDPRPRKRRRKPPADKAPTWDFRRLTTEAEDREWIEITTGGRAR